MVVTLDPHGIESEVVETDQVAGVLVGVGACRIAEPPAYGDGRFAVPDGLCGLIDPGEHLFVAKAPTIRSGTAEHSHAAAARLSAVDMGNSFAEADL
ncbi:hypothetical protein ACIRP2_28850 [Streptomyces sp. NPDC101194]|uniref:hypothetical protein n=1 Tax=Streptomyces sp. NPDC101194 TaxID=3366127 RepID=UPI003820F646